VSRAKYWKKAGWGLALVAAVVAPSALYVVRAAPEPDQIRSPAPVAAPAPFARICKATAIVDPRPQPAWVGASYANDNCAAPRLPAALDGYAASRKQVIAAMAATKRYGALSDAYQRCISGFVAGRQADAPLRIIENHRILVAQENRKVAEQRVAAAIVAFNEYGSDCPDH
jgi:hypothetical protein